MCEKEKKYLLTHVASPSILSGTIIGLLDREIYLDGKKRF